MTRVKTRSETKGDMEATGADTLSAVRHDGNTDNNSPSDVATVEDVESLLLRTCQTAAEHPVGDGSIKMYRKLLALLRKRHQISRVRDS